MGFDRRIFNFSAGPATIPTEVLEKAQSELLNFQSAGMSVMEMSHRSKEFDGVLEKAESTLRELTGVGDEHAVLFLQGGAQHQFAMAPLNFVEKGRPTDLVQTGYWTQKAAKEIELLGELKVVASSEDKNFSYLPPITPDRLSENASYLHYCSNNTIFGTQYREFVRQAGVPLVCDMSSDFLSRQLNFSDFDLIFAGAQKNVGPSGIAVVIIRKEFAERGRKDIPSFFQYREHIKGGSRLNTPNTWGIYLCGLVLDWLKAQGGLAKMESLNQEKAGWLYDKIDSSDFWSCPVRKEDRSLMNVVYRIKDGDEALEKKFIAEASAAGLSGLKGHRHVGGLRASIYNAHPAEGVKALVQFMDAFEKANG